MKKRLLSIALTLAMIMTMIPTTAFALETPEGPLVYVSIGDSMTNGYGLDGYDGESGIMNYGNDVYANQFAAWLAGYEEEIEDDQTVFTGSKGTVDHRQLAMSGLRAEDLAWLLQLDYANMTDDQAKWLVRFKANVDNGSAPWNTSDTSDNICYHWGNPQAHIHGWEYEWGGGREYWYSKDVENPTEVINGYGFKTGDWRTWTDLLDPQYRLADGAAKILSMYGTNGFTSETVAVTESMITNAKNGIAGNAYYPTSKSQADSLFGAEGRWLRFAAEFYQDSVADADVLTLALGNTNFGTFMFDQIKEMFLEPTAKNWFPSRYHIDEVYLMAERVGVDDELMDMIEDLINEEIGTMMEQFADLANEPLPNTVVDGSAVDPYNLIDYDKNGVKTKGELIKYIVEYCVLSYIVHYIASVERIVELNPDVELIQIALMNAYKTGNSTDTDKEGTSFADLIDKIYEPMNAFIAMMPTYLAGKNPEKYEDATFYYSDVGTVETLSEVFGNDFYTYNGSAITYDEYHEMLDNGTLDVTKLGHNTKSVARQRFHKWLASVDGCKHEHGGNGGHPPHPYISDCYLCMEIAHNPIDTSYGWKKSAEYGEMWKWVLGPLECTYPDDAKNPTQADKDKYNAGWDFNKYFDKYRIVFVSEEHVREYEKLTLEEKNARLHSDDIIATHKTPYGNFVSNKVRVADLAFSCAMYLAFEDATIRAGKNEFMMHELLGVNGLGLDTFGGAVELFAEKMGLTSVVGNGSAKTIDATVTKTFSDALVEGGSSATMLCLANRVQIGTGIGGHPSQGGHDTMFEAIMKTYEEGYTSQEQVKKILWGYLEANYPDLVKAIGAAGAMGDMDDLAIIMAMLKLSQATGGNPALENVDLDKLEGEIREVLRMYEEDLTIEEQIYALELANDVMDRTQNLASKATYSKYEPDEDSFYVSLGDSNVNGYGLEGYVDGMQNGLGQVVEGSAPVLLAKELYGEEWKDRFGQYAQGALRSEDMLWILTADNEKYYDDYTKTEIEPNLLKGNVKDTRDAYIEALEKADLISVAIGGGNVTTFVGRQVDLVLAGKDPVEMDWEKIGFGYPALLQLDELLDVLVPLMDKMGLLNEYLPKDMKGDVENPTEFARVLAESLLYGYASYNYYYPQVLARIRQINPDAQILILGMFNPVDEWELNMEIEGKEVVIPIGGAISNVLESANLQNLAYALQNENTTFVDLSDNYTFLDAKIDAGFEPTFADYYKEILKGNGKEVHANADGHVYMFNQMYAALQDDYMDDMVSVAIEFFKPLAEKYGQDVYEYIINNPYKVAAFIDEYGDEMSELAKEYYDEAYAYAYIYADKKGYIDCAADVLDEVLAAVESVDVAELEIPASVKDELEDAIAIVKQDIANLKSALENDEFDTVENLLTNGGALLGGMYSDLRALDRLAESAGIDLYNDALALCEAKMEAILECIEEMKESFHEKLEDLIAEAEDGILGEIGKLEDISLSGLKKLIADLEEQIAVINAQLETLQGYTGTEVTKLIEELQSELAEAEAYLDKLTALTEKVEDLVNEIENEPELTVEKVQAIVADAKSIIADTENLVAETQAAMVELAAVYEAVMPQLIEALQSAEGPVGEALDVTAEEIEKFAAELTAGCEKTVAAVNAAADEIEVVVADAIAAVSESVAEAVAAIEEATIEAYDEIAPAVEGAIEEIEAQASALAQSADAEIRDAAQAILDELEKLDVDTAAYEEKLAEASEIVAALMDEAAMIETAVQAVAFLEGSEAALRELAAIAEEIYALAETDVPAALSDIGLAAKNILETVNGSAASLGAAAFGASTASAEAILDAVNTVVPAAKKAIGAYEAAVATAAGEITEAVTAAAEEIGAEAVVVLDTAVEAVEGIVAQGTSGVESVVEAWSKVFYDATHGELDVDCKTSYVALGSSVAYAEELAELLGAYITLSTDEADLAEADLVTIGVDTADMVADIEGKIVYMVSDFIKSEPQLAKLLSNENLKSGIEAYVNSELDLDLDLDAVLEAPEKEVDWSQYPAVDTDVLDAVLAEVESALVKNDVPEIYTLDIGEIISPKLSEELGVEITVTCVVDIPVAALVMEAAEYVLYAYAGYAAEYDDIYNMVPEGAQVVLTGTYQPEEIQEIAGISIGEYVGYAFAAMDVQPLVYALVNDNTTFVSVQETNGDAEEMAEAVYAALDVTEIGHDWDAVVTDPTCTEDGYITYTCLKCGETYTEDGDAATGHAWGDWTDNGDGTHSRVCANDAKHVESGAHKDENGDNACDKCGKDMTPAHTHVYGEWKHNETEHWKECACGEITEKAEHTFTGRTCDICGYKKPSEGGGSGGGSSRDWHCPTCKSDKCHSKAFSDLDLNAWYHKYTDYVLCKGLMNGMGGDIFAPNATTTRAMIITTLYRMEGSPAVSGEIAYADVAEGTWYTDAVIWGTENGIVKGYENATFDPMGSVTREQIAAIFNRYATYKKVDTKKAAASLDAYVDAAQVSAWAVEDMKWAVGNKFIVGRTDTTLVPNGATTRAEMATLLYRWANEIAK